MYSKSVKSNAKVMIKILILYMLKNTKIIFLAVLLKMLFVLIMNLANQLFLQRKKCNQ